MMNIVIQTVHIIVLQILELTQFTITCVAIKDTKAVAIINLNT